MQTPSLNVSDSGIRVSATVIFVVFALGTIFHDGLVFMVNDWSKEEYSHGYLIPLIAGYLIWKNHADLVKSDWTGAWSGM